MEQQCANGDVGQQAGQGMEGTLAQLGAVGAQLMQPDIVGQTPKERPHVVVLAHILVVDDLLLYCLVQRFHGNHKAGQLRNLPRYHSQSSRAHFRTCFQSTDTVLGTLFPQGTGVAQFCLWVPTAQKVELRLYESGRQGGALPARSYAAAGPGCLILAGSPAAGAFSIPRRMSYDMCHCCGCLKRVYSRQRQKMKKFPIDLIERKVGRYEILPGD